MKKTKDIENVIPIQEDFDFDTFQVNTIEDVEIWNRHARKAHRAARLRDKHAQPPFPIKVPNESMHRKVKVKFQRFDQPDNVLKVWVRNKDIDWRGQLKPGRTYDLPIPVVKFLNKLAVPIYAEVKVDNGGDIVTETRQVGEKSRFSCQVVDFE